MDSKVEKLRKKAIRDQLKRLKPGECQKYLQLVLDSRLFNTAIGQALRLELLASDLKYTTRDLPEAQCILWERSVGQRTFLPGESPDTATGLEEKWQTENQVLRIFTDYELQQAVSNASLGHCVNRLSNAFPQMQYSIVVAKKKETKSGNSATANALIDLQLLHGVSVLQVRLEEPKELLALLQRLTKSIAEAPFKQQKSDIHDGMNKYLANDKKQCVRVEGANGMRRLWQQHLNRLPLVTLEVAEAIIAEYSCPKKLIREFEKNPNAVKTISELRISRSGPQPLQTDRRVGNKLSTKFHTLYTSRDPDTLL